jgi:hypothetical protein
MPSKNKLAQFVDGLVPRQFPTKGALAEAIGMTDSGFSRAVQDDGTLTVEQCLRLAMVLREDFPAILRTAGREALAGLVTQSFRRSEEQLSRRETELVRLWRSATVVEQQAVFSVLAVVVDTRARTARSGLPRRVAKLERRNRADEKAVAAVAARVAKTTAERRRTT